MPRGLYPDGPEHTRRRSDARNRDDRGDDGAREESPESSDYPDRLGAGRRRRDRDLIQIDRMHCLAEGDEARHAYVVSAEVEPAMRTRETQFATAQAAYVAARATVQPILDETGTQLEKIEERVLCLLEHQNHQQDRLDLAWRRVQHRLERCQHDVGQFRHEIDCDFDYDLVHPLPELLALQAQYTDRVTEAESEFDELMGEPDRLTARGTALQNEVDALKTAIDGDTPDASLCYAELLVAGYHRVRIWEQFDTPNEYEDRLRDCLRCSVWGRRALTGIVGEIAVRRCQQSKKAARCAWLKDHLATEIVAEATEIAHQESQEEEYERAR